ncbi:type II toxin-antitoxin system VapC family toxin [Oscillatoria sp. CS-180]|uniref:type II toxin-antitoxin system VapC family toxin n=1 Tax=Oscillatoria sp. CS-180 TaxID=3021720 RepID=UPI00232A8635|nr:type II toxin-antitoxin system VapC family toxin [Oscillatoria sp. CS-180]MDB9528961.1 type II toxin-antitoxin system VapC family toxin [Oscillatoria sp. CS-180]
MNYLMDTCIISELVNKHPNSQVIDWVEAQVSESLYLSVITIGEIAKGINRLPTSHRKSRLVNWLMHDLLKRFAGRVCCIDIETMLIWGNLLSQLESYGRKLPLLDSLIAATALQNSLYLATRNTKDFEGTGIEIVNPFST